MTKFINMKYSFAFVSIVALVVRVHIISLYASLQSQHVNPVLFLEDTTLANAINHDSLDATSKSKSKPKPSPKSNSKPKLIIHVGPQKTATTTIQLLIQQNAEVRNALKKDNYIVISSFDYSKIRKVYNKCFLTQINCTMWDFFAKRLEDEHGENNNVIWSNEELVNLPMNNFTIPLWRSLLNRWNIQVLIFHRPFHQWIYSMYLQDRKRLMYRSGPNQWIDDFGHQSDIKHFTQWLRDHKKSNAVNLRDTMAVKATFEELYGSSRVHVLDMMASHGVEMEFLSNDIINAPHAVEAFERQGEQIKQNPALLKVIERMDTDLIIVQGHRQHLGDLSQGSKRIERRMKLESKLKELNMTTADLPTVCISKQQEDWLWDRTLHTQRMFSRHPLSEEELRSQFAIERKKWCDVNARALMWNSTWKDYLSSCEFQNIGCNADNHSISDPFVLSQV